MQSHSPSYLCRACPACVPSGILAIMVGEADIQDFVNKVVEEFSPQRVILFGSYARGDATPDSDVDLLVVMPTKKEAIDQAVEVRQRIRRTFPLDLIVKTPEELRKEFRLILSLDSQS